MNIWGHYNFLLNPYFVRNTGDTTNIDIGIAMFHKKLRILKYKFLWNEWNQFQTKKQNIALTIFI